MKINSHALCHLDDIPQEGTRGFELKTKDGNLAIFLVRQQDDTVVAYKNHCPHLGIPLNWQPDEFLSLEGTHIQCSTHGALFTLEKGLCVMGPCSGEHLESIPIEQRDDGSLWLEMPD